MTTPDERCTLLKAGKNIGSKLKELISIFSYDSFLRWVRDAEQGSAMKKSKSPDHPGTDEDVRQLIVQMHGETGDSYTLLEGRLKRLGSCASSYHFQVYQQTVFR